MSITVTTQGLVGSSQKRIYRDRNRFQLALELYNPTTEKGREGQRNVRRMNTALRKDEHIYEKARTLASNITSTSMLQSLYRMCLCNDR